MKLPVDCFCCGKVLTNATPSDNVNQPNDAVCFLAPGQYGSTVFDPMDGSSLEINICDECLQTHKERVILYVGSKKNP